MSKCQPPWVAPLFNLDRDMRTRVLTNPSNEWHLRAPFFKLNNTLGHPHYGFSNNIVRGEMACPTFYAFVTSELAGANVVSVGSSNLLCKHDCRAWKIDKSTIFVGWRPDNDVTKQVHGSYQLVHESSQLIIHSNACAVWQWKRLRSRCEFSTAGKNFQKYKQIKAIHDKWNHQVVNERLKKLVG